MNIIIVNLKDYISLHDLKCKKVAKDLGISKTYLSLLMNEKRNPGKGLKKKIEEYLK